MKLTFTVLLIALFMATGLNAEVIVPNTSTWKWLFPNEGIDPAEADKDFHSTFFKPDFDDSKWESGKDKPGPKGGFGYESDYDGVEVGVPDDRADGRVIYLRLKFETKKEFNLLKLKCQRDDSFIAYVDGEEVIRDNLPKGKDDFNLFAVDTISGADETTVFSFPFRKKLKPGEHTLVISLHNRPNNSSDLRIAEISLETAKETDFEDPIEDDDLF